MTSDYATWVRNCSASLGSIAASVRLCRERPRSVRAHWVGGSANQLHALLHALHMCMGKDHWGAARASIFSSTLSGVFPTASQTTHAAEQRGHVRFLHTHGMLLSFMGHRSDL